MKYIIKNLELVLNSLIRDETPFELRCERMAAPYFATAEAFRREYTGKNLEELKKLAISSAILYATIFC